MKNIFKKLHKSHNDTLTPPDQSPATLSDHAPATPSDHAPATPSDQAPSTPLPVEAAEVSVSGSDGLWSNRGGDFLSSEEEFQMELALAISASNSELRRDPENDQILAAKWLSLGKSNSVDPHRQDKEVLGEAISRRYWDYGVLDYEDKVIEGFYDVYAISMDPTSQREIPSLADLETNSGDSGYEAVIINKTVDPMLLELEQVAHCIAIDCPPSNVSIFVRRLAELVTDHMGGAVKDANIMLAKWMDQSAELRTSLHTSVFPIGSLKLGITRHRALLFKLLADNVGLKCKLVKGSHYTGVEDDAFNVIKLDKEREFLVDLMADPGTLIPADVLRARDSSSQSNNQVLKKLPFVQRTNDSVIAYPRPYNPGYNMDTADNHAQFARKLGNERAETSSSSAANDTSVGPSRISIQSTSPNQMDFPSTSAVGASLHKANRGNLTVGDGSRLNVNVVPYNKNNVDGPNNLFADLNPFQIRGTDRFVQTNSQEYKGVGSQRQRNDTVLARPPLPMMWKTHQVINEAPRKRDQGTVHISPNTSKGANGAFGSQIDKSVGNHEAASVAATSERESNRLFSIDSGKTVHDDGSQRSEGTSSPETVQKNGAGVQDHRKYTHDRFMETKGHRGSGGYPIDPSASSADPVLDDVGECEIPWEDLDIGERIGLGSYGEVHLADWNGTEVAVKKFLDQDFSGAALAEFKREVRIMRRLRHPNVVLFMGAVTRPPNLSIISEYLPRGSLYRIIHRPTFQIDEKRRLRMALDVARGMNCLHTSTPTIVHRDLKSPNLLVDRNWTVKVCDFGLSRLKHNTFLSSKSTAGTPEWMAPEVLRNEQSNEKCDVYSFGIILWELTTLRLPWTGMNPMQVVGAVGFQNRRLEIPQEVDPLVARIISECWQTDPNLRPSFAQLCVALKPLQHLNIQSPSADQQSSPMPHEISVNSTP